MPEEKAPSLAWAVVSLLARRDEHAVQFLPRDRLDLDLMYTQELQERVGGEGQHVDERSIDERE